MSLCAVALSTADTLRALATQFILPKAVHHGLDVIDVDVVDLVSEEAAIIEDGGTLGGGALTAALNEERLPAGER